MRSQLASRPPAAIGLTDLTRAVGRHRKSAILVTVLLVPLAVLAVFLIPPQYDSYGQILVRLGRGSVSLDPTTSLTPTVSLQESRASQVNSVTQMIDSRAMAMRVVDRVGADRILRPHHWLSKSISAAMDWLPKRSPSSLGDLSAEQVEAQVRREEAVKVFQDSFAVLPASDAYTINLEVRSGSPFLSKDLLAAVMDEYQAYHVQAHQSPGSLKFFQQQTEAAFAKAVAAKEAYREAKTARGIIEMDSAKSALRSLISQVESDRLTTDSQIAAAASELAELKSDVAAMPENVDIETVKGIPKTTGNSMRQSLYDLEVVHKELVSRLKPGHPKLLSVQEQLDSAREIARGEVGEQPQTRETLNPVRQSLELSLRTTQSRLSGLQAKKTALERELESLKRQLAVLNEDEVELTQLAWEATLTENQYLRAAEHRDQAKQLADLEQQNVSEISVTQPATLELKKAKPRRASLAGLAILLSLAIGIGQAIIRGLFRSDEQLATSEVWDAPPTEWRESPPAFESSGRTAETSPGQTATVPR